MSLSHYICLQVTYVPGYTVKLSKIDYGMYVASCLAPLPPQFDASATKRIVQYPDGYTVMSCTIPHTTIVLDYMLTLNAETGVYTFLDYYTMYLVTIDNLHITVHNAVVSAYDEHPVVFALDSNDFLCNAWYDVTTRSVQLTEVIQSVRTIFHYL